MKNTKLKNDNNILGKKMKLTKLTIGLILGGALSASAFASQAATSHGIAAKNKNGDTTYTIGGFWPNWEQYRAAHAPDAPNYQDDPSQFQTIVSGKNDYLTYAFYKVVSNRSADNTITHEDEDIAGMETAYGAPDPAIGKSNGTVYNTQAAIQPSDLIKLANIRSKYPDQVGGIANLLFSIGGWSYTNSWHDFFLDCVDDVNKKGNALTPENLINTSTFQKFKTTLEAELTASPELLKNTTIKAFDGVNIDWETPGFIHGKTLLGTTADTTDKEFKTDNNGDEGRLEIAFFVAMVHDIKTEKALNNKKLTVAMPAFLGPDGKGLTPVKGSFYDILTNTPTTLPGKKTTELQELNNDVDRVDYMSFDLHGQFDAATKNATTQSMSDFTTISNNLSWFKGINQLGSVQKFSIGFAPYVREMLAKSNANDGIQQPFAAQPIMDNSLNKILGDDAYNTNLSIENNYLDPANPDTYAISGGMVDRTGVYAYRCMKDQSMCPVVTFSHTLKDATGQDLPEKTAASSSTDKYGNAWYYYKDAQTGSSVQSWVGSVDNYNNNGSLSGFPVFTGESTKGIKIKITALQKKYSLQGVWFWDLNEDMVPTYEVGDASLSATALLTIDNATKADRRKLAKRQQILLKTAQHK